MRLRLPLGYSDFAQIRRGGYHYVDKTGLAVEVVESSAQVLLLPRPRRFGKTVNLSMLRYWFERTEEDRSDLFAGLAVMRGGVEIQASYQRYPVIFLTFKDVKHPTWGECLEHLGSELATEVSRLRAVWDVSALRPDEQGRLCAIAERRAGPIELGDTFRLLTRALHLATGEPAVLLIDEYDTPIHSGWSGGYYDAVIGFFRNLLSAGLKDNVHLHRGVLTGILRVAKESIFSGLNNISVHTLLSRAFSNWFGFTEPEVLALAEAADPGGDLEGIQSWYNGYRMGPHVVYNPWSVLSYLSNVDDGFRPYWVNTASNDILRRLLVEGGLGLHDDLITLLRGGEVEQPISENIVLRELDRNADAVWSFLLFSGYLKVGDVRRDATNRTIARLSIPNLEVGIVYREVFSQWIGSGLGARASVQALCEALLHGDEPAFRSLLQRLVVESLSFFDTGGRRPEAVYQSFIIGLLLQLESTHIVDSNRESGFGRYDVCVRPRIVGGPGAVLELKSIDPDSGEDQKSALDAAMAQVKDRAYATALRQAGATPIWLWAAVFDGKRVWARVELSV